MLPDLPSGKAIERSVTTRGPDGDAMAESSLDVYPPLADSRPVRDY